MDILEFTGGFSLKWYSGNNKHSVGGKKICSTSLKFGFSTFCQLELDLIMPRNGVTT